MLRGIELQSGSLIQIISTTHCLIEIAAAADSSLLSSKGSKTTGVLCHHTLYRIKREGVNIPLRSSFLRPALLLASILYNI